MRRIELYEAKRWIEMARVGDAGIYWIGNLPADKRVNRQLGNIAASLWRLSNVPTLVKISGHGHVKGEPSGLGRVRLFQRRTATASSFEYIVSIIRRPSAAEILAAFKE